MLFILLYSYRLCRSLGMLVRIGIDVGIRLFGFLKVMRELEVEEYVKG